MLIRNKAPRRGDSFEVTFGQFHERRYLFQKNDQGEFVCDVANREDAKRLLSIPEGYEIHPSHYANADADARQAEDRRKQLEEKAKREAAERERLEKEGVKEMQEKARQAALAKAGATEEPAKEPTQKPGADGGSAKAQEPAPSGDNSEAPKRETFELPQMEQAAPAKAGGKKAK